MLAYAFYELICFLKRYLVANPFQHLEVDIDPLFVYLLLAMFMVHPVSSSIIDGGGWHSTLLLEVNNSVT